jgi:hypothetical protein
LVFPQRERYAKINVADNTGIVKSIKILLAYSDFEFLFADIGVLHGLGKLQVNGNQRYVFFCHFPDNGVG